MTVQPCHPRYKPPVQDIKIIQEHHRTNHLGIVNICTKRSASAFKSCCDISEKRPKRWPAGGVWVAVRGSWFILWAPWTPVVWSQSILFKSRTKWRSNQPSDIAVSTRTSTNYEILFSPLWQQIIFQQRATEMLFTERICWMSLFDFSLTFQETAAAQNKKPEPLSSFHKKNFSQKV